MGISKPVGFLLALLATAMISMAVHFQLTGQSPWQGEAPVPAAQLHIETCAYPGNAAVDLAWRPGVGCGSVCKAPITSVLTSSRRR